MFEMTGASLRTWLMFDDSYMKNVGWGSNYFLVTESYLLMKFSLLK